MKTIHFPTELWVGEGALANLETLHDKRYSCLNLHERLWICEW